MADNVVEVGDFSIARKGRIDRYDRQKCRHLRVELNDHGETVICSDCGVQVSAYWALNMVAERLSAEWSSSTGPRNSCPRTSRQTSTWLLLASSRRPGASVTWCLAVPTAAKASAQRMASEIR